MFKTLSETPCSIPKHGSRTPSLGVKVISETILPGNRETKAIVAAVLLEKIFVRLTPNTSQFVSREKEQRDINLEICTSCMHVSPTFLSLPLEFGNSQFVFLFTKAAL